MRTVIALVLAIGVSLSAAPPAQVGIPHPGMPGPYAVGHTSFLVVDSSRNADSHWGGRPIPINAWYPADRSAITDSTPLATYPLDSFADDPSRPVWPWATSADWEAWGMSPAYEEVASSVSGPFPLVVVSPGWTNRHYNLQFYAEHLASHGFVVAVVEHYLDGAYPAAFEPWDGNLGLALLNRPADVAFALEAVLDRNSDAADVLFNSIRPDMIAASGHSLGGYAAMALAAGDDEVCGSLANWLPAVCQPSLGTTLADPRIKAIVSLDGSNQAMHFTELARITVPSIAIGQAWETCGSWNARLHVAISGRPAYRVDVRNALHPSFTNNCTTMRVLHAKGVITHQQLATALNNAWCKTTPDQPEINRLAAQYAVAFLQAEVVGERRYQRVLTPGWALTAEQHIEFFVTEPSNATALGEDPTGFLYFVHQSGSLTERAERDPKWPPFWLVPEGW